MTYTQQYNFGVGTLVGVRTDSANPTPQQFGVIQEVSVDVTFAIKELHGQNQFPVAVARAAAKVDGKAKFARINTALYNDLFFDNSATGTAIVLFALNEAGSVPGSSAYTITVANGANFVKNYGVVYAATGQPLQRVAAASEAAGKYSVNESTGVYTFHSSDASTAVFISYSYSSNSGGTKVTLANKLMGSAPTFQLILANSYQSNVMNMVLNACISNKLSLPFKNQDFTVKDFEFHAFVDTAGNWGTLTTTN